MIEATFFQCVFAGAELEALVERLEMHKDGGGDIGTQKRQDIDQKEGLTAGNLAESWSIAKMVHMQ